MTKQVEWNRHTSIEKALQTDAGFYPLDLTPIGSGHRSAITNFTIHTRPIEPDESTYEKWG